MATDYSWIQPLGQNMQNAFGLNPRAAAEGRTMQAEQAAAAAKAQESQANTERVRTMTPYEVAKLIAEKDTSVAQGGLHTANTNKVNTETQGIADINAARKALQFAFENGALMTDPQTGELTFNPNAGGKVMGSAIGMMNPNDIIKLPDLLANLNQNIRGQSMTPASNARIGGSNVTAVGPFLTAQAFDNTGLSRPLSVGDQKSMADVTRNTADSLKLRVSNDERDPLDDRTALGIAEMATREFPGIRPDLAVDKWMERHGVEIGVTDAANLGGIFSDDAIGLVKRGSKDSIDPYSLKPTPAQPTTIAGAVAPVAATPATNVTQVGGTPAGGNPTVANPAASTGNAVTDHNVARTIAGAVSQEGNGTNVAPPAINPNLGQPAGVRAITTPQEAAAVKEGELISVQGKILKKMNGQFIPVQ